MFNKTNVENLFFLLINLIKERILNLLVYIKYIFKQILREKVTLLRIVNEMGILQRRN